MADFRNFLTQHFGPGFLAGITLGDWLRLLAANRFRTSPRHWARTGLTTLNAPLSSGLKFLEDALFSGAIRRTEIAPPVFVLGSWRSGTTFLHTLLSVDKRFGCPNLYETMNPHTFLLTEAWWRPVMELAVPRKRFMDDMKMSLAEPHEDEMALAIMSQRSNMLSWVFPQNAVTYDRHLSFRDATEADREAWKKALHWFVQKIAYKTGAQVVLKSPNHTARIRPILETFPNARFLHIRRHPYDVYRSFCHMASQVIPMWGLQAYRFERIPAMVMSWYAELYDAFFEQVGSIPVGQFHEVKYEDLAASPVEHVAGAYAALGLPDFSDVRPALESYVAGLAGYRKNRHAELEPEVRQKLAKRWKQCFDAWDYQQE